jgi:hypothetical protein
MPINIIYFIIWEVIFTKNISTLLIVNELF